MAVGVIVLSVINEQENKAPNEAPIHCPVSSTESSCCCSVSRPAIASPRSRSDGTVLRRAPPSRVITPDRCCSRRCARASRPLSHPSTRTCSLCESGSRSSACLRCESCCEQSVFRRTVQAEEQTQKHSLAAALTEWLDYLWAWELFLGLIICILGRTKLVVPPGLHSLC